MAEREEGQRSIFSVIIKDSKDHAQAQDVKIPVSNSTKYTKSAHSISPKDSVDMKTTSVVESNDGAINNSGPLSNKASSTNRKKKSPRAKKLSQVGVDNSLGATDSQYLGKKATFLEPMEAPEVEADPPKAKKHYGKDKKFKHRKQSLWYRLRRRHVHMGVVEVNYGHPFHLRLQAISLGMQSFFTDPNRLGPAENLNSKDYKLIQSKELTLKEGTTFLFENYAPAVFATIRRALSVEDDAYMESIINRHVAYLEFISNSRSGQDFFLSANMRYLIKTNKKRDVQFLLSILGNYLNHFLLYPHSLLVKYLGCYSIKLPGKKKIFFLVMQNIFYPADRIEDRFDVKGCTAGRYQEPDPPGSQTITVLKDQNFFQEELQLGTDREWFIKQLTVDATFLRGLNVMDYSLLVGRQKLQESEHDHIGLPDLVTRVTRSGLVLGHTCEDGGSCSLQGSESDHFAATLSTQTLAGGSGLPTSTRSKALFSGGRADLHFPHSLSGLAGSSGSHHRRLLPKCRNALHIIDGPDFRYFFGIVDFLTRWTQKQKVARLWKVVKYGCGEHSTMPPDYYCRRFVTFITARVS
ncbi:hypothetical protein ACOMHN_027482 [Nucella lapillus]